MARTWEYDLDQMIYEADEDWIEYGCFGADTYGLHTKLDGKNTVIQLDAENSKDAIAEADKLLDKIADGWRAINWECSITEAAELLGVSRQRVHVLLQNGQLEGRKVGNTWSVSRQSVENRIESQRKPFEQYELDAYLGEFADDFDVEAIIDEATVIDYKTGNRYWKDGIDLAEICAKHDKTA